MEILGVPPPSVMAAATRKEFFFHSNDTPILKPTSRGKIRQPSTRPMDKMLGIEDPLFMDFLMKTLEWDPDTRITPMEALQHDWISQDFPKHLFVRE